MKINNQTIQLFRKYRATNWLMTVLWNHIETIISVFILNWNFLNIFIFFFFLIIDIKPSDVRKSLQNVIWKIFIRYWRGQLILDTLYVIIFLYKFRNQSIQIVNQTFLFARLLPCNKYNYDANFVIFLS